MADLKHRLHELLWDVEGRDSITGASLLEMISKLKLYIKKFFDGNEEYLDILNRMSLNIDLNSTYSDDLITIRSIINTLLEEIEISNISNQVQLNESDKNQIIQSLKNEIESDISSALDKSEEIKKVQETLLREREELIQEEEKFNEFKSKLEIADKSLDFQFEAIKNRNQAKVWAIIIGVLIIALFFFLYYSLENHDILSNIAKTVKTDLQQSKPQNDPLVTTTIYITFGKYLFTKILLYSLIIYAIVFCVKNYNAQMHNSIVNNHKSNALKSTFSLLNTAKSEDGNDKLLIQATQAIFSHQHTGYSGPESEPTSPNLVTNVIDAASKKI